MMQRERHRENEEELIILELKNELVSFSRTNMIQIYSGYFMTQKNNTCILEVTLNLM